MTKHSAEYKKWYNNWYQVWVRERKWDEWKAYHTDYMQRKRMIKRWEEVLKTNTGMSEKAFDKHFKHFKSFLSTNYCLPTIRDMMFSLEITWHSSVNTFYDELVKRWFIIKVWAKYRPTKYLMVMFFNINNQ